MESEVVGNCANCGRDVVRGSGVNKGTERAAGLFGIYVMTSPMWFCCESCYTEYMSKKYPNDGQSESAASSEGGAAADGCLAKIAAFILTGIILIAILCVLGYLGKLGWDYYQEKVVAKAEKKAKAEERMTAMIVENDQAAVKEIAALKAARAKVLADRAKREAEEAERRRQEELRLKKEAADAEKMAQEEERKSAMLKDMKAFAVKEAPKLWETTVKLRAEIESTEKRLAEMRKTLETAKKDPESDATYLKLLRTRNFAIRSTRIIDAKLEAAFIAAQKFAAAPGKQELSELKRKALEDGANEADAVAARFGAMQAVKEAK